MNNADSFFHKNLKQVFFGFSQHHEEVFLYTLSNSNGMEVSIMSWGATIVSLQVPINNEKIDVVLGFASLPDYIQSFEMGNAPFFGSLVGRCAGRISNAAYVHKGKVVQLDKNQGENHLHGGKYTFSTVNWKMKNFDPQTNTLVFHYLSKANEYYPGDVSVDVAYTLTEDNTLQVKYMAHTTADTLLNLTQHTYFNLDGHKADVRAQELKINAEHFLELNPDKIPTGRLTAMENHAFDFRTPKLALAGIDNAFVLKNKNEEEAVILNSPKNGLTLKIYTNQAVAQIYVGGKISEQLNAKEHAFYHAESGICFEMQNYPDAPNHKHFPDSILKKGETYNQYTCFQFIIP